MRVTCHHDDRAHAEAAGHLVVTHDPEAMYFHEAPDDETVEALAEHAKLPIIVEIDGCSADLDFRSWAAGWLARHAAHRRKVAAGVRRAIEKGYSPKRTLPPRTEAFARSLIEMGLPLAVVARKAKINWKTARRIKMDLEKADERRQ